LNKLYAFAASVTVIFSVYLQPVHAAIIEARGSGNNTYFTFDPDNADLSLISNIGYYHLDYASNGNLYAFDRGTDALYQLSRTSSARTKLADLSFDSGGGGFTVSNDGSYLYFTSRLDHYDRDTNLFRYSFASNQIESLGDIITPTGFNLNITDIEFGRNGSLYATGGHNGPEDECGQSDFSLFAINLDTLTANQIGSGLGIAMNCRSHASSLNADADGTMHMLLRPGRDLYSGPTYGSKYYMGTIDLSTGLGEVDYLKVVTEDGGSYTPGVNLAYLTAVPVPAAVWLFASALAGLGWLRRRNN
jgi:hypothetical protein